MTQVVFLTFFLGLVSGTAHVEVLAEGPLTRLELFVDHRRVASWTAPPYRADVDFGPALEPQELIARAVDAQGRVVAEARQWVNLARPPAEIDLLFERDATGTPVAVRPVWGSLAPDRRPTLDLRLDGQPLPIGSDGRALLPLGVSSGGSASVLSAEIRFSSSVVARRDLALGGDVRDGWASELTALAAMVPLARRESGRDWTGEDLAGRLVRRIVASEPAGGSPPAPAEHLDVVAVERGAAEIVFVRGVSNAEAARRLRDPGTRPTKGVPSFSPGSTTRFDSGDRAAGRFDLRMEPEDRVRFLWPVPSEVPGASLPTRLFDFSPDLSAADGGVRWLLSQMAHPAAQAASLRDAVPRFADAVAVAGLQAAAGHRRRVVVLVLGAELEDASHYDPSRVAAYLRSLRVPLRVWSLRNPTSSRRGEQPASLLAAWSPWAPVEDISTASKLRRAFERLREDLDRQRMVWVSGLHPPGQIEWAPTRPGQNEFSWP